MVGKEEVEDEIQLIKRIKHPHLSSFIDAFDTPKNYVIIIELLAGGRLFDHLAVMDNLSEKVAIGYVREILEGVQHLRDLSVVHLDLKVRLRIGLRSSSIFSGELAHNAPLFLIRYMHRAACGPRGRIT